MINRKKLQETMMNDVTKDFDTTEDLDTNVKVANNKPLIKILSISLIILVVLASAIYRKNEHLLKFFGSHEEVDVEIKPQKSNHLRLKDDQPQQKVSVRNKPMILGLGQGTTGTHSLFNAICNLGIPSVHHQAACTPRGKLTRGLKLHLELLNMFIGIHLRSGTECGKLNDEVMDKIRTLVDKIIASGDVDAVFDTPYPFLNSHLIRAAEKIRGVPPLIIVSERDPLEWAKRRSSKHGGVPFCKNTTNATIDKGLDWFKCYDESKKRINMTYSDIFESAGKIVRVDEVGGIKNITKMIQNYQDTLRPIASYVINLFDKNPPYDLKRLEDEMSKEVRDLQVHWNKSNVMKRKNYRHKLSVFSNKTKCSKQPNAPSEKTQNQKNV